MTEHVLLLSGGIDSTALAYSLEPSQAITVDYGQIGADAEIHASTQICDSLDIDHNVIEVDCSELGLGSMSENTQIETASTPEWWPFRNQLIITLSAMKTVEMGGERLVLGTVKSDREHGDGRPEFFELIDSLLSLQEGGVNVSAPAIGQTSVELVKESGAPESLLGWTHSCHVSENACGRCRGCTKKQEVMREVFRG